jgi:hypothetical protein
LTPPKSGWFRRAGLLAILRPVCKSLGIGRRGAAGLAHGLDFNSLVKQPNVKQPNFQAANSQTNQKILKTTSSFAPSKQQFAPRGATRPSR